MEFRKMVTITLYARQRKRHRCIEQTFGLYERRRGWDDLKEQHQNMYIIKCETGRQSRLDAWDRCLGLVHWDDPEGWDGEGGGKGGSGWGTHINPWLIHVNVWQKPLQYCKVISLQLIKIIGGKKKEGNGNGNEEISQIIFVPKLVLNFEKRLYNSYYVVAIDITLWIHRDCGSHLRSINLLPNKDEGDQHSFFFFFCLTLQPHGL